MVRLCVASAFSTTNLNRLIKTELVPAGTQFTFEFAHGLKIGDTFIIGGSTRTQPDFEGSQTVSGLTTLLNQLVVDNQLLTSKYDWLNPNNNTHNDLGPVIYAVRSIRFETLSAAILFSPAEGWNLSDIVFIDDGSPIVVSSGGFGVSTMGIAGDFFVSPNAVPLTPSKRWVVKKFNGSNFLTIRLQPKKLDTDKVINALIYNNDSEITSTQMSVQPLILDHILCYDPINGRIPGVADREIYYKLEYDPAKYNTGTIIDDLDLIWGDSQIGRIWWDLRAVRYLETELNDIDNPALSVDDYNVEIKYRIANWGTLAPNTTIDIYEWVKSPVPPSQWATNVTAQLLPDIYSGTVFTGLGRSL